MKYEEIDPMSREEVEAAMARDDPDELSRAVMAVALHSQDLEWASSVCTRLASHHHFNVRGNSILGFGHLARRHHRLNASARDIIESGLRDPDPYVRGHAVDAADDVGHFLGWRIMKPN